MKKTWSEIEETTSVFGIRFMFFVYRILGRFVFSIFLFPVIAYYYFTQPVARLSSKEFLSRVQKLEEKFQKESLNRLSYRHFLQFGNSMLDKLAVWAGKVDLATVSYSGREEFLKTVDKGKGALVIASHLGNQEISRVMADSHKRVKLNILVHTKHAQKFNKLLKDIDETSSLNLIQVTEVSPSTAMMLSEKINAGEVIVIAGDRAPIGGGRQSSVNFLGDEAVFPQGPYILASIFKCPVFLLFCVNENPGYKIIIEHFAEIISLPRKQRDRLLTEWAQKFAARLGYYARQYPLQWYNFFDFWQDNPERKSKLE